MKSYKRILYYLAFLFLFIGIGRVSARGFQDTLNIDFGNSISQGVWNNLTYYESGVIKDLIDCYGWHSGISITVSHRFNECDSSGAVTPDPSLDIPSEVISDSFYGRSYRTGGRNKGTGSILLSGLDTSNMYSFSIIASSMANDNRQTKYVVTGKSEKTVLLNVTNNISESAEIKEMKPASDGTIALVAAPGPDNNNPRGLYFLGAIRLYYFNKTTIKPDTSLSLLTPKGGERWENGSQGIISWKSTNHKSVKIEYSLNNGDSWIFICNTNAYNNKYIWDLPKNITGDCIIRVSSDGESDQGKKTFTVVKNNGIDRKIVVLGCSITAGWGPSVWDSAWVWMYRAYLQEMNTDYKVINLAQGGFTTYNILPDGSTIPDSVKQTVFTEYNITKALSLSPSAIIISLSNNDATNNYPVKDQLANYEIIMTAAKKAGVPLWISTTLPANFKEKKKVQIQMDMKDSTFSKFGDYALDFWTGLATEVGTLKPLYTPPGGGDHINNAGHKLLFNYIVTKNIQSRMKPANL